MDTHNNGKQERSETTRINVAITQEAYDRLVKAAALREPRATLGQVVGELIMRTLPPAPEENNPAK